jgi:hypothetical protein
LEHIPIRPYTDKEWEILPHVFLTSEREWDPSVMDHEPEGDESWGVESSDHDTLFSTSPFDEFGQYRQHFVVQYAGYFTRNNTVSDVEDVIDQCIYDAHCSSEDSPLIFYDAHEHEIDDSDDDAVFVSPVVPKSISRRNPDYKALRPFFGWLSVSIIRKTFEHTTQYACIPCGTLLQRTFKSPNPALHVTRRNESVACDIVYADTAAVFDGSTSAVIFVGADTQVTDVYIIKTDKQFVNTLEDNIIHRGSPNKSYDQ